MINKPVKIRIRLLAGTAVVAAVSVGALLVISGATLPATGSTVNPSLSLEYRGEPKERVDIGPISVSPSATAMHFDGTIAADLLEKSNAMAMIQGGSESPVNSGYVLMGLVSDWAMQPIPAAERPAGTESVTAPPITPLRDTPALVVVFPQVMWNGLHGGGGPYGATHDSSTARFTQTSTVVVAFEAGTGEFLFMRTLPDK
jgi:hypothetical protein